MSLVVGLRFVMRGFLRTEVSIDIARLQLPGGNSDNQTTTGCEARLSDCSYTDFGTCLYRGQRCMNNQIVSRNSKTAPYRAVPLSLCVSNLATGQLATRGCGPPITCSRASGWSRSTAPWPARSTWSSLPSGLEARSCLNPRERGKASST